jgi:hypothetical protein
MRKEPKRLRPLFALAMIGLAAKTDKCKDRERLIRSTRQYGKCGNLSREEVEWVLDHTIIQLYRKEWKIAVAEKRKNEERMKKRRKS